MDADELLIIELLEIKLKEIEDNKKLWDRFGKKALELAKKKDFKALTNTESKMLFGFVHSKDFRKGLKLGYAIGIIQAIRCEKYYRTGLEHMQDYLEKD